MKLKIFSILKYILLVVFGIFMYVIFYPNEYDVPKMKNREGTNYWNLKTGSRIAFTLIRAKGIKKPYPFLFLQGGPGGFYSNYTIKSFTPIAEKGYDVYLYDQIGSGHSARLTNINEYTADRHKKDLEEIVKKIGAPKVILIGQSWGAILATLYIADNPEKVEKVIFTGPGPIQPPNRHLASIQAPESLQLRELQYQNSEANEEVQTLRTQLMQKWAYLFGRKLCPDKEADEFQTLLNSKLSKATVCDTSLALKAEGGGGYYAQIMTVKSLAASKDPRPALKQVKIPALIMKGQCDNQKWGYTSEYLQLFKNHKLVVIAGAGHSISIEQPALYISTILGFLNE